MKRVLRTQGAWLMPVVLFAAGCDGSGERFAPLELARGFEPARLAEHVARWEAASVSGAEVGPAGDAPELEGAAGLQLTWTLPKDAWRARRTRGHFAAALPRGGVADQLDFRHLRVQHAGQRCERAPARRPERPFEPPAGSFAVEGTELVLFLDESEGQPDDVRMVALFDQGREEAGAWRVASGNAIGEGLPLWPDVPVTVTCDVPPRSALRLLAKAPEVPGPNPAPRVHVRCDEAVLYDAELGASDETGAWLTIPLPVEGGAGLTLELGFHGARGMGVAFEPTVAPLETGSYGARPWKERPDVVLVLADTFRADNLTAYGSQRDHTLTPELDAWTERSLVFPQARSTATWTLPALSSLMTGAYPPQHGAVGPRHSLPEEFFTLAEHLRAKGYRTVAVTDSFFASRRYGLAQGFSWFREIPTAQWSFRQTLDEARAALARDDGRPVFLLVHTYRTHKPYRLGVDEDRSDYDALVREVEREAGGSRASPALLKAQQARATRFFELYAAGVRDLDARLGGWLAELEELGILRIGMCALTSDHGESFDEHGEMFHRLPPWEEQVRVPLVFRSDRLRVGSAAGNASLVDLPRTVAGFCGLPAPGEWGGRALLSEGAGRLTFSIRMAPDGGDRSQVAAVVGTRKLFVELDHEDLASSKLWFAYDLAEDPRETDNLVDEPWVEELYQALLPDLERLSRLTHEPGSVPLGAAEQADIEALGYGGDEER